MLSTDHPYFGRVAVDKELARANFAQFIQRALDAARTRGMTDETVKNATGVGPSTFHRWRRGDWGTEWPKLQQVIDFCDGLGLPEEDAFAALGLRSERGRTAPPAPLDPDVREVMRRLADPNVSKDEKAAIRLMFRSLATYADAVPPVPTAKPSTRPIRRRRRGA